MGSSHVGQIDPCKHRQIPKDTRWPSPIATLLARGSVIHHCPISSSYCDGIIVSHLVAPVVLSQDYSPKCCRMRLRENCCPVWSCLLVSFPWGCRGLETICQHGVHGISCILTEMLRFASILVFSLISAGWKSNFWVYGNLFCNGVVVRYTFWNKSKLIEYRDYKQGAMDTTQFAVTQTKPLDKEFQQERPPAIRLFTATTMALESLLWYGTKW